MAYSLATFTISSSDTSKGRVSPSSFNGVESELYSIGNVLYNTDTSTAGTHTVCTVTVIAAGYIPRWQCSTSSSGPWTDISTDVDNPTLVPSPNTYIQVVFDTPSFPPSQTITLTNNHNYIVMTTDSATAQILETTMTISNTGKIDLIDLGAGTRGDGPCVLLICPDGPSHVPVATSVSLTITLIIQDGQYWNQPWRLMTSDNVDIVATGTLPSSNTTASIQVTGLDPTKEYRWVCQGSGTGWVEITPSEWSGCDYNGTSYTGGGYAKPWYGWYITSITGDITGTLTLWDM